MLGAIAGDIIGSRFEHAQIKTKDFELFHRACVFTDDTVHTVAVADSLLHDIPVQDKLREYFLYYPTAGYGGRFRRWARSPQPRPYDSFGNGSAMRVSPVAWLYDDLERVLQGAIKSAECTHNHPEGLKGAQAVAGAIYLARTGEGKDRIKAFVCDRFGYDLSRTLDEIRSAYRFEVSCQKSVPQAITAFLEAGDVEDAIRNAVSLGGDSDTLACIAGSLAEAFYGSIPDPFLPEILSRLDDRLCAVINAFQVRIGRS